MLPTPVNLRPLAAEGATLPELVDRATALIREFPECFWYWRPDARLRSLDDVRLVVRQLRRHGDRRAWIAAQELNQCLSQTSR
ncbi:MAG TPA: hypothetical protein VF981_08365 [Gemmatimonadaceae bacterium]